jgi:hypothetical protein
MQFDPFACYDEADYFKKSTVLIDLQVDELEEAC